MASHGRVSGIINSARSPGLTIPALAKLTAAAESRSLTESRTSSSLVRGESLSKTRSRAVSNSCSEYVALEKLEGMYALNPLFATLLVHGDSTQSSIVAVAVLDPLHAVSLVKHALGKSVSPTDIEALETLIAEPKVRKEVLKGFAKVSKQNRLNGFEMIKGVHLTMQPFAENLLTPTLKVKR